MRFARSLALSAGAFAFLGGSLAATGTASAAGARYVAMGDSYSSGVGAGSYDSGSGSCQRSTKAYPQLWANAHAPASFSFVACSGATTSSVNSGQLGSLSSSTTLVSISVGGNDIGFSNVMSTCVTGSDSSCTSAVNNAETSARNTLPGRLDSLFAAIKSRAPSAHVVVLGYPHLYKITSFCIGLSNTKRNKLNEGSDVLDTSVSQGASRAGFTFSDVRDEFSGHELCSGDDWLNSVTLPIGNSYHPTALGQAQGYLPAFTSTAGALARASRDG